MSVEEELEELKHRAAEMENEPSVCIPHKEVYDRVMTRLHGYEIHLARIIPRRVVVDMKTSTRAYICRVPSLHVQPPGDNTCSLPRGQNRDLEAELTENRYLCPLNLHLNYICSPT